MTAGGKSLFASVLLHAGVVIAAAVFVVRPPSEPGTEGETDEPRGLFPGADAPSELPGSAATDDSPFALPPESVANSQTESLPRPVPPPVQIPPVPQDLIATSAPSSLPPIDPPATTGRKSQRKTSRMTTASRTGNASRSAGSAGNGTGTGAAGYIPARYSRCPAPPFPAEALKARVSGTVLLLVDVDESGRPVAVAVRHSSGHDVLDSAALRAVRTWRFEPARLNGKQVNARLEIPVRFAVS